MSEWHSAGISITVFHQDHFWGFDFRDCWIEYYCMYSCTQYTCKGSRLKDKTQNANTSAYVTLWGPQAPVSQDIENDQWKLKSRAWPPTPYPLPIQYPPQACLIWGVTIGAVKTKFPFSSLFARFQISHLQNLFCYSSNISLTVMSDPGLDTHDGWNIFQYIENLLQILLSTNFLFCSKFS